MSLDAIPTGWLLVGFLGQLIFGTRTYVQWIVSERRKRVVIPTIFWWISIVGSIITLAYCFHRGDTVFIVSNIGGTFVYTRNLILSRRAANTPVPGA